MLKKRLIIIHYLGFWESLLPEKLFSRIVRVDHVSLTELSVIFQWTLIQERCLQIIILVLVPIIVNRLLSTCIPHYHPIESITCSWGRSSLHFWNELSWWSLLLVLKPVRSENSIIIVLRSVYYFSSYWDLLLVTVDQIHKYPWESLWLTLSANWLKYVLVREGRGINLLVVQLLHVLSGAVWLVLLL